MGGREITAEYAMRLARIGDWYNHMEGCLECHESDDFNYKVWGNKCNVTKKNGKSYFHFPEGGALLCGHASVFPKNAAPCALDFAFVCLPEYFENGLALPHLHITGIPVDDLDADRHRDRVENKSSRRMRDVLNGKITHTPAIFCLR